MSILALIAASMPTNAGLPVTLSAPFNDISDPTGGGSTVGNAVSLTMSSGQTITYTVTTSGGTLQRSLNGGAYSTVTDGATLVVANGDTLQHQYSTGVGVESGSITLTVSGVVVGSFDVTGV